MLVLPLFVVLIAWYLIICWKWKKNIFDIVERMPGLKWYPFFGTFLVFKGISREDVLYKFAEITAKYGPFYRSWHGTALPEVHLTKPDHIQTILRSSSHTTKGPFYNYIYEWLGDGLFISEGAKWFFQRKLVTPKFHFKILETFIDAFAEKTTHLIKVLEPKADGQYFDVSYDVSKCTLKIICETSMGVELEAITDKPLEHIKNTQAMTEMAMWRYWRPYIKDPIFKLLPQGRTYKKILNDLHGFADRVVACKKELRRVAKLETKDGIDQKKQSFLDLIMDVTEDEDMMTDADLRNLVNTFLVAGYDTTATTATWALFSLGNHPEIQERLFQEVRGILKGKEAPSNISELNEMKYLECVIKETLRLYPVLPFITRNVSEDINIDGYTVPVDTQAVVHIFLVQRDPAHYPEPNKFDPARFTPENSKDRHAFAYIPFSAGPRNCLGMRFALLELKAVLATIINRYKVTSLQKEEEMKFFAHIILRPQTRINVKLERRD